MELLPLTLDDKTTFEKYIKRRPHSLSSYAFENIFIWRCLYEVSWQALGDSLCCFFKDKIGMFMPLPPQGQPDAGVLDAAFRVMEEANHNKDISRIENIEADALELFKKHGFRIYEKTQEYVVAQKDIAGYRGGKFRHKRNLANFFKKNHSCVFRDYGEKDKEAVLELCREWMRERAAKNNDPVYQSMLKDAARVLSGLLDAWPRLSVAGKVAECDGKARAFTCGFPISEEVFCVNFEIADLSYKGLPAFVFSEFAKTLEYPEINIMDDSGIENIRSTKLSFHPVKTVPSYTALMK